MSQCVVLYGYKDVFEEAKGFENLLIEQLKQFVHHQYCFLDSGPAKQTDPPHKAAKTVQALHFKQTTPSDKYQDCLPVHTEETLKPQNSRNFSSRSIQYRISKCSTNSSGGFSVGQIQSVENEKQFIQKEMEKGVMYQMGETELVAENDSSIIKRIDFRQGEKALSILRGKLLKVGNNI